MIRTPLCHVIRLGRLPYISALKAQHFFQKEHFEKPTKSNNALLILEHPPVYTLGLREKIDPQEEMRLTETGAEIIHTDRGGLTTFHGPGQLVMYPILHLDKFRKMTLKNYVSSLEHVAIHTCRMLGVPAKLSIESVSHTGAWANNNKICAIGVHCKRHVTTHGLALNCNVDLNWFKNIVPCGIQDKGVTSLSAELGENISVDKAVDQLLSSFESIFRCKLTDPTISDEYLVEILESETKKS